MRASRETNATVFGEAKNLRDNQRYRKREARRKKIEVEQSILRREAKSRQGTSGAPASAATRMTERAWVDKKIGEFYGPYLSVKWLSGGCCVHRRRVLLEVAQELALGHAAGPESARRHRPRRSLGWAIELPCFVSRRRVSTLPSPLCCFVERIHDTCEVSRAS